ncbi:MAG: hypothetical protein IPG51_19115 [Chloroflexi bacterium]|nr:hypothetical protein [Chloroflexota bacterium]
MVAVTVPMGTMEGDADTAVITATSRTDSLVNAAVLLTTTVEYNRYFFPMVYKSVPPPPTPLLTATNPNSANDWQMNWTIADGTNVLGYELQQSQDAAFVTGITTHNLSTAAVSQLINTVEPSHQNVYYFRLRALGKDQNSGWTSPVQVIGAYLDNFTSNQTGWSGPTLKEALRRLTFIEKKRHLVRKQRLVDRPCGRFLGLAHRQPHAARAESALRHRIPVETGQFGQFSVAWHYLWRRLERRLMPGLEQPGRRVRAYKLLQPFLQQQHDLVFR